MSQYKWMYAKWGLPISLLSASMLADQFNNTKNNGFLLSKSTNELIVGRFVEKEEYIQIEKAPLGEDVQNTGIRYITTSFKITNTPNLGLELRNPPRSIKKFIAKFRSVVGFDLVITEHRIDPFSWVDQINQAKPIISISSIHATDINIANSSLAKVSIAGSADVRENFKSFIGARKYTANNIKINIKDKGKKTSIELKSNGVVNFKDSVSSDLYETVKSSLCIITESKN